MLNCKKCNKLCDKYIWFGPDGEFCDNCVPRFECYGCNYFASIEEAKEKGYNVSFLKKLNDGLYYLYDNKGRLNPCVDYFCADLESSKDYICTVEPID